MKEIALNEKDISVIKALKEIRDYCHNRNCSKCIFADDAYCCISGTPEAWEVIIPKEIDK